MSCPMRDELYHYPRPGLTPDDKERLRTHAQQCGACGATTRRLGFATAVLANDPTTLDGRRRAEIWASIEARTEARTRPWTWSLGLVGSAAVVGALLLLVVRFEPSAPEGLVVRTGIVLGTDDAPVHRVPVQTPLVVKTPARLGDESRSLSAAPDTELVLRPLDTIELIRGHLDVDVAANLARPSAVTTSVARIEAIGAAFTVDVAEHTDVVATRGRVHISTKAGATIALEPPERWSSAPPPAEPEPEPEPTPALEPTPIVRPAPRAHDRAQDRADLERARAMVEDDAPGARRIAEAVLANRAAGPEEVDALALIADVHRRNGERTLAAEFYERVAEHPAGRGYAEEALLRRARLLFAAGDAPGALASLERARDRFADGPLAPERAAFTATIHLGRGDVERAAAVLESARGDSLALRTAFVEVADALAAQDPARAARLRERTKK